MIERPDLHAEVAMALAQTRRLADAAAAYDAHPSAATYDALYDALAGVQNATRNYPPEGPDLLLWLFGASLVTVVFLWWLAYMSGLITLI